MKEDKKKLYIRTFGCQMNERDSEIIYSMMMEQGYVPVSSYDEADLIIFNTCSVRKHAEDRAFGNINQLQKLKAQGAKRKTIIGLVGCMGKAYGKKAFEKAPGIDFVCGPSNIYDIPKLVEKVSLKKKHLIAIELDKRPIRKNPDIYREEKISAWVNISEGCNNFCSYCIVPYVRGREVSRPLNDILDEIKRLAENGTKEITLLGQNVNSYIDGNVDFIGLLEKVNGIAGLKRIRFMTSHPKDANPRLFKAVKELDKVCKHLHLPLQSGSDRILALMNRGYDSSHYLKLIGSLKGQIPDSLITTDVIVGFPTETEEDFKATYMLMKEIGFDNSFIFKYSPRPFTKANELTDDIPKQIKEERHQILLNLQDNISKEKIEGLIGKAEETLGISIARRPPNNTHDTAGVYIKGRTEKNYQVIYKGNKDLIGETVSVKIRNIEGHTLIGELA